MRCGDKAIIPNLRHVQINMTLPVKYFDALRDLLYLPRVKKIDRGRLLAINRGEVKTISWY